MCSLGIAPEACKESDRVFEFWDLPKTDHGPGRVSKAAKERTRLGLRVFPASP